MGYKYYDTPDGQDCLKKLAVATKYGAIYGLFTSALDVLCISHPKGYGATFARIGYVTLPFLGVGATFATSTCLLTDLRNKDDHLNYLIGGALSGAIVGVWQRSAQIGSITAVFFGIGACVVKDGVNEKWSWISDYKRSFGDFWTINYDLSLTKERPKSWVKE